MKTIQWIKSNKDWIVMLLILGLMASGISTVLTGQNPVLPSCIGLTLLVFCFWPRKS